MAATEATGTKLLKRCLVGQTGGPGRSSNKVAPSFACLKIWWPSLCATGILVGLVVSIMSIVLLVFPSQKAAGKSPWTHTSFHLIPAFFLVNSGWIQYGSGINSVPQCTTCLGVFAPVDLGLRHHFTLQMLLGSMGPGRWTPGGWLKEILGMAESKCDNQGFWTNTCWHGRCMKTFWSSWHFFVHGLDTHFLPVTVRHRHTQLRTLHIIHVPHPKASLVDTRLPKLDMEPQRIQSCLGFGRRCSDPKSIQALCGFQLWGSRTG